MITFFITMLSLFFIVVFFLLITSKEKDNENEDRTYSSLPKASTPKAALPTEKLNNQLFEDCKPEDLQIAFDRAIEDYEAIIFDYPYLTHDIGKLEKVYVVDSVYIIYISVEKDYNFDYPQIFMEEMTYNSLFKFNATAFGKKFENPYCEFKFIRFWNYEHKKALSGQGISRLDYVHEKLPDLNLLERLERWEGIPHHYVVLELYDDDGSAATIKYITNDNVEKEAQAICRKIERYEIYPEPHNEINNIEVCQKLKRMKSNFIKKSEFDKTIIWSLRGHLHYFFISETSTSYDLQTRGRQLLDDYNNGKLKNIEWHEYGRFEGKWKSEFLVFELCQKIYGMDNVIFQYSPEFLGAQSYDVYIISKKTAIEYQGKQHSEPVEFFGGQESFEKQQERDARKRQLSKENKVKLVYINYDEPITEALIRERVESKK